LREFIAFKNPEAAKRVSLQLKESILKIIDNPNMGVDVLAGEQIQDLVQSDYIIRYTVRLDLIIILRVWHSKEYR